MSHLTYKSKPEKPLSIAYLLLYFPHLTETFVADEIRAIQSQGIHIQIISLLKPKKTPVQPFAKQLLDYTSYAPGLLSLSIWRAQFYFLLRSTRLYFHLLFTLLRSPLLKSPIVLTAKRLIIFLKSVSVAYKLKDSDIGLFHSHFAWLSGASAWICSRLLKRPFTVTVHAFDIYSKPDLLKLVLSQATHIVSISKYNRNHISRIGIYPLKPISIIHCGINLSEFNYQKKKLISYQPNKPLRILSVGSLTPKKGHKHLINACNLLKNRGFKFTCTVIGGGKEESILRHQIISYGLQKQVILSGARTRPEILKAYATHDLFILASIKAPSGDMDGIPVVLMEAAAMGLPIISTRVSGIPELIRQNKTGLLVPPSNPRALADAITTLAINHNLQCQLSQNAQKLIKTEFNQEVTAKRLIKLFHNVLANRKI